MIPGDHSALWLQYGHDNDHDNHDDHDDKKML